MKIVLGLTVSLLLLSSLASVYGQQVDAATMEVSGIYRTFKSFAFGVSAVCALIGSVKAYSKFSQGDNDFRRSILVWFGACLVALLVPRVLDAFFL